MIINQITSVLPLSLDQTPEKQNKKQGSKKEKSEVPNTGVQLNEIKLKLDESKDPSEGDEEERKRKTDANGESSTKKPDSSVEGVSEAKSETEKDPEEESDNDSQLAEDSEF